MNYLSKSALESDLLPSNIRMFNKDTDFQKLADLMKNEWKLGYLAANVTHDYASNVYANLIYAQSQYLFTYVNNSGDPIGFVGYANKHLKKVPKFKEFTEIEMSKFNNLISRATVGNAGLENYYLNEDNFEKTQHQIFDNYLEILILDKNYRKSNIAQEMVKLIQQLMTKLKQLNPEHYNFKTLSIYTTSKCSYRFYDKIGCELAYIEEDEDEDQMIYTLSQPIVM